MTAPTPATTPSTSKSRKGPSGRWLERKLCAPVCSASMPAIGQLAKLKIDMNTTSTIAANARMPQNLCVKKRSARSVKSCDSSRPGLLQNGGGEGAKHFVARPRFLRRADFVARALLFQRARRQRAVDVAHNADVGVAAQQTQRDTARATCGGRVVEVGRNRVRFRRPTECAPLRGQAANRARADGESAGRRPTRRAARPGLRRAARQSGKPGSPDRAPTARRPLFCPPPAPRQSC